MHRLVSQAEFYALLLAIDRDMAEEVRQARCPCRGALHVANYKRSSRGAPPGVPEGGDLRFSFCCEVEGCRRRVASIRR